MWREEGKLRERERRRERDREREEEINMGINRSRQEEERVEKIRSQRIKDKILLLYFPRI
jgi:hypothetical protein